MQISHIVALLQTYRLDCLLLALPVCGLTALVKRFVPARAKKFLTLAPFLFGVAACAAYAALLAGSAALDWHTLLGDGLRCGGVATVYYIAYEQFVRGKRAPLPASAAEIAVLSVLESQFPGREDLAAPAARICTELRGESEPAAADKLRGILGEEVDEETLRLLARLLVPLLRIL